MLVPSTAIVHLTINSQQAQKVLQNMTRSHDRGDDHAFDNAVAVLREQLDISLRFENVRSSTETYFEGLAKCVHLADAPAVEADVERASVNSSEIVDELVCAIKFDTDETLDSLSVVEARVTALDEKVDALIGKLKQLGSLKS